MAHRTRTWRQGHSSYPFVAMSDQSADKALTHTNVQSLLKALDRLPMMCLAGYTLTGGPASR